MTDKTLSVTDTPYPLKFTKIALCAIFDLVLLFEGATSAIYPVSFGSHRVFCLAIEKTFKYSN